MAEIKKKQLLAICFEFVENKERQLQTAIKDAQNSLEAESHSTAGDKHDTSRAMIHLEIEKKNNQIQEIVKLKRVLSQIDPCKKSKNIGLGSIVKTNNGTFFIAINGGKYYINDHEYTIISLASPLGQSFKNNRLKTEFIVMKKNYVILDFF